jgi:hypothetical protein
MDELLTAIAAKKVRLDELRPLSPEGLARREHSHRDGSPKFSVTG